MRSPALPPSRDIPCEASSTRPLTMNYRFLWLAALLLPVSAEDSNADVLVLVTDRDSTMFDNGPTHLSNGAGNHFVAGVTNSAQRRRATLYFDIAATIPAGATINSVSMELHCSKAATSGNRTHSLHRLTTDWGEAGSHAPGEEGNGDLAQTGDITWNYNFYSVTTPSSWTTPGGDFQASASASQVVGPAGFYSWTSPSLASDVQAMLDSPGTNFGWLLKEADEVAIKTAKRYDTKENLTVSFHPRLTVDYTPVAAIGSNFCVGATNSVGLSGSIAAFGSVNVQDNQLQLVATQTPPNRFGLFFFGPNPVQVPLGSGHRCVGGQLFRFQPATGQTKLTDWSGRLHQDRPVLIRDRDERRDAWCRVSIGVPQTPHHPKRAIRREFKVGAVLRAGERKLQLGCDLDRWAPRIGKNVLRSR